MISGGFPTRFLKCSFYFWSLSSWLAAFSFALETLFLFFTSFTFYYAICYCLSSIEFLILLIWPWMYSNKSFWYRKVCSVWAFLVFCILVFVGNFWIKENLTTLPRLCNTVHKQNCCGPVKGLKGRHELRITWNKYIEQKYKYSIGKRVLNISLIAKVLGWN